MASENNDDWERSLPSSSSTMTGEEEEEEDPEEKYRCEQLAKLNDYVNRMSYRVVPPPVGRQRTNQLAQPKKTAIFGTLKEQGKVLSPTQRRQRVKYLTRQYTAITTEQLENIIRQQKHKEMRKEALLKKKQEVYYDMLTKLEQQCRSQYLNVLIRKFASHIAKTATTMHIPLQLMEPYSRMQRGIFCNILVAMGIQPSTQSAMLYNTVEGKEFEVCHNLAHALLSLIIKALDAAVAKNPDDLRHEDTDFNMDNYIKDRLMCAAQKKIVNRRKKTQPQMSRLETVLKKCQNFQLKDPCLGGN